MADNLICSVKLRLIIFALLGANGGIFSIIFFLAFGPTKSKSGFVSKLAVGGDSLGSFVLITIFSLFSKVISGCE